MGKREIVFKDVQKDNEEAKDILQDLPTSADFGKKNIRLSSPPPDVNLPSELRKMSYRELNKQCLSSYSSTGSQTSGSEVAVPTIDDEDEYSWPALADETIDEVKTNYTSISPIMQAPQSM